MKRIAIAVLLGFSIISVDAQEAVDVLRKASDNIEKINNVSYRVISCGGEPDDNRFTNIVDYYEFYTKNEKDSIVKTKYYFTMNNEPDKVSLIYDGVLKRVNWNDKNITIDSVNSPNISQLPYYPVSAPVLIRIKAVIDYVINNPKNSEIIINHYVDSTIIKINFPNKVMEFLNMLPWDVQCSQIEKKDRHSSYTIWLNNENLPYKFLREVHTERRLDYIKEFEIKNYTSNGVLPDITPADFKYVDINKQVIEERNPLELKIAPMFSLSSPINKALYSLNMYHGKVILLDFTGIGCGHCKEAIPFLNDLKDKHQDLVIIGIETFVDKPEFVKNYIDYNKIKYDYMIANKEIKEAYNISGVPHFFILDKDYMIVKSITGYYKGYTDAIISEEIRKLIE